MNDEAKMKYKIECPYCRKTFITTNIKGIVTKHPFPGEKVRPGAEDYLECPGSGQMGTILETIYP